MNTTAWEGPSGADRDEGACLVVSLLSASEEPRTAALELLGREFGPLASLSGLLAFEHTKYYEPEMGAGLTRRMASFQKTVPPWELVSIKLACLEIEKQLAGPKGRRVNLDPGILSAESLVLASTKPRADRVCLAPGLHAQVTLVFREGRYRPGPFTYQDYADPEIVSFLNVCRNRLLWRKKQAKHRKGD